MFKTRGYDTFRTLGIMYNYKIKNVYLIRLQSSSNKRKSNNDNYNSYRRALRVQ